MVFVVAVIVDGYICLGGVTVPLDDVTVLNSMIVVIKFKVSHSNQIWQIIGFIATYEGSLPSNIET